MAIFAWKGLKDGQYASGRIEGINRDEAAFKVKEQKNYHYQSDSAIGR